MLIFLSPILYIFSCLCQVQVKMNYIVNSESDFNDLVVMIKKSETADLMDYTNSGQPGGRKLFFPWKIFNWWRHSGHLRDEKIGFCGYFLIGLSWLVILLTFPFSLLVCFKVSPDISSPCSDGSQLQVVAEYERAVIFRLGRLKKGGSLGPGLHFEIPCVEHAEVVDMRTSKMKVPPQEVFTRILIKSSIQLLHCRSWPRTPWLSRWTRWCSTGCPTPPSPWPTWRTRTTPPGCWLRPPWETSLARRTCMKSWARERAYRAVCRWRTGELSWAKTDCCCYRSCWTRPPHPGGSW